VTRTTRRWSEIEKVAADIVNDIKAAQQNHNLKGVAIGSRRFVSKGGKIHVTVPYDCSGCAKPIVAAVTMQMALS